MYSDNNGKCRYCGADIYWQTMASGKRMPCDAELMAVYEGGDKVFIREDGRTIRGTAHKEKGGKKIGLGRVSHFATCPRAREARRI